MSDTIKNASELIKSTRLQKGLTQQELADKLGLNKSSVNRYESGVQNITLETLEKIMQAMGEAVTIQLKK